MDCEKYISCINGHLDATNTTQEEESLQEHLNTCAYCRALFEQMSKNDACLKSMTVQAPSNLTATIMEEVRRTPVRKAKKTNYRAFISTGIATAAIIAIALVGSFAFPLQDKTADTACEEVTVIGLRRQDGSIVDLPLTQAPSEALEGGAYFFGDPIEEVPIEISVVSDEMPILVIRADVAEVEFEGDRISIRDLRDRLKSSKYSVSGKETAAYAVTWEALMEIAAQYEGVFEMEKYYSENTTYMDATIIFSE